MQKTYKLIFIALLLIGLCVSGVQAAPVNFTAFAPYGDLWKSHNDTYTIIMANSTGSHTILATGNFTSVNYLVVAGGGGAHANMGPAIAMAYGIKV